MMYFLFALFMTSARAEISYSCPTRYDELNIPHVETTSIDELYYCFGLNHGRDRAWAMDYFRRVAQGRNAEMLGFSHLKSDLMMRVLNMSELSKKIWKESPDEKKKMLEIYSRGVNEGFKIGKNSVEFKNLNFEPEPWKPEHSLLVLLLQSFDQTRKTFFRDYEEEKYKKTWGAETVSLFDEDDMPWENTILKEGEYEKKNIPVKSSSFIPREVSLWGKFPSVFGIETGSNNWAISKSKAKNGKAILANDPHLDLKTPMFWYWISLKSPDAQVMGGSVPGVPVIASGTNGKVAWGLTNSYANSADALLVKDIPEDEIESFRPKVMVKWWFFKLPFFFKSFEKLKSGHRILPLELESDDKLVLRWSGFSLKPEEIYPMFDLLKTQNVSELNELLANIGLPSWNFVFADSKGDIGYRMIGKTYQHTEKIPFGIPTIERGELEQEKFLKTEDRPQVLKPDRHYVYSSNNRHWPGDAKFYGGRGYSYSFRGYRIEEILQQGKQDVPSFQKIQCDTQVVDARFFLPKLQQHLRATEFENWSMEARDDSLELPLYRRLMDLLMEKWNVNEYALFRLLDQLNASRHKELMEMFILAKAQVAERNWGDFHRVKFPHLSKNPTWIFAPDLAGIGDAHSVNPGTAVWNSELGIYEQNSGASMRMIIEMDQTPRIWLALPGLNREYDTSPLSSAWKSWKNCEYTEIKF
jgi:penicillin amidase